MKIKFTDFKFVLAFLSCMFASHFSYGDSSRLIEKVCAALYIKMEECYLPFATEKIMPADSSKSIVVIPKITEQEEEYFSMDSYIVIVENKSGKIIATYFESSETNNWTSDAVKMQSITIDTAPYLLNSSIRAFGIRVLYYGSSRVNPFSEESISLFIQQGDKLIQILKRYPINTETGEWDGNCAGNFWSHQRVLLIENEKTNGFANILVKDKIIHTITTAKDDDCIDKDTYSYKNEILKCDGKTYKVSQ